MVVGSFKAMLMCGLLALGPGAAARAQADVPEPQTEAPAAARTISGARIYREASPSVVLIETPDALGSGVVVGADGRVLTNLHVVGLHAEVKVFFKPLVEGAPADPKAGYVAKVLRRDEVADLALLQVTAPPPSLRPLTVARGPLIAIGSNVHAIGHPTGQTWTYTRGIVSQVRRDYAWSTDDDLKHHATVIQTQTPVSPGSSGGPLLDDRMRVVGINTFTREGEGLHFAISAEDIAAFLVRPEDRRAERAGPPPGCVLKMLKRLPAPEPGVEAGLMDEDCDGIADFEARIPADRRKPVLMLYDTDGDGRIDMELIDRNHDRAPDEVLYDSDGDGRFDLKGFYRRHEHEPYRYERIDR